MVMETPTPQCVGLEFVRQYYTVLNKAPLHLHRFFSHNSSFLHGAHTSMSEPIVGQADIHKVITGLNFRDCHAKIRMVDAQATLGDGVVIQVTGELSNNGNPMRRFMQTFVLAPQTPKKYYVHNDIFRYQDEVFSDEEGGDEGGSDGEEELEPSLPTQGFTSPPSTTPTAATPAVTTTLNGTPHPPEPEPTPPVAPAAVQPPVIVTPTPTPTTTTHHHPSITPLPVTPVVAPPSGCSPPVATAPLPPPTLSPTPPAPATIPETAAPERPPSPEKDQQGWVSISPSTTTTTTTTTTPALSTNNNTNTTTATTATANTTTAAAPTTTTTPTTTDSWGTPEAHASWDDITPPPKDTPDPDPPQPDIVPPQHPPTVEPKTYANLFKGSQGFPPAPPSVPPTHHHHHHQQQHSSAAAAPAAAHVAPSTAAAAPPPHHTLPMNRVEVNSRPSAVSVVSGGIGNTVSSGSGGLGMGGQQQGQSQGGSGGGGFTQRNQRAVQGGGGGGGRGPQRDRTYRPNSEDNSELDSLGGEEKRRPIVPDSQQIFVGNLPHTAGEEELMSEFSKFGKIMDIRINTAKGKTGPKGQVPNFGFITFEEESTVTRVLDSRPIHLNGEHRLNVEEKKARLRVDGGGGGGMGRPTSGRGGMGGGGGFRQGPPGGMQGRGGNRPSYNRDNSRGGPRGGFIPRR